LRIAGPYRRPRTRFGPLNGAADRYAERARTLNYQEALRRHATPMWPDKRWCLATDIGFVDGVAVCLPVRVRTAALDRVGLCERPCVRVIHACSHCDGRAGASGVRRRAWLYFGYEDCRFDPR